MNKEQIIQAIEDGKKVYINGFDWFVKKMKDITTPEQYQIVSNENEKIFCPLLNEKKELVLKEAKYIAV